MEMEIERSSWHYRLCDSWGFMNPEPYTLCEYFWRIVGTLAVSFCSFSVILFASGPLLGWIAVFFLGWNALIPFVVLPTVAWLLVGTVFGSAALYSWLKGWSPESTAIGIAFSYVRAAKRRVCPLVYFVS